MENTVFLISGLVRGRKVFIIKASLSYDSYKMVEDEFKRVQVGLRVFQVAGDGFKTLSYQVTICDPCRKMQYILSSRHDYVKMCLYFIMD